MANRALTARETNRFLSVISNAAAMAKLKEHVTNSPPGSSMPPTYRKTFSIDPADKIIPFPIAGEEGVISLFQRMKARLAKDSTSLGKLEALDLAKATETIAEMRMALIKVQLGRCIECMRVVWPHFVEARSLVAEAGEVIDSLQSLEQSGGAAVREQETTQEHTALVEDLMNQVSPFLERHSRQRKSAEEFINDPAAEFFESSAI